MKKYLIKVVHEELIDSFDLDNIRGGNIIDTCNCNSSFSCKCDTQALVCDCNAPENFSCGSNGNEII